MDKDDITVLAFANALSFLLREGEGIITQAECENGMQKFLVWREEGLIKIDECKIDKPVGSMLWIYDNKENAIVKATLNQEEYLEN